MECICFQFKKKVGISIMDSIEKKIQRNKKMQERNKEK